MKKYFNNIYINTVVTKGVMLILSFISMILLNRYLSPEKKGEYAYILNMSTIISTVFTFGIYQTYGYYIRKFGNDSLSKYLSFFLFKHLIILTISLGILVFTTNIKSIEYIIIFIPIQTILMEINHITIIENINYRNSRQLTGSVINIMILIAALLIERDKIIYVLFAEIIKDLYIVVTTYKKLQPKVTFCIDKKLLKNVYLIGITQMATLLLGILNYKIDVIILKSYVTYDKIGLYSIAVGLANYVWIIPDIFKDILFNKTAKKDSIPLINLSLRFSLTIVLIFVIMITIFGENIIEILFGAAYKNSYSVTVILMFGIPLMIYYKIIGAYYINIGKMKFNFLVLFVSVIANIIANYLLIPKFGINGAAISSILSYSICGIIFLIDYKTKNSIKMYDLFIFQKEDYKLLKKRVQNFCINHL